MDTFETNIAIRAYSECPDKLPLGSRPFAKEHEPSPWTLIFDCETTIDAVQQLRVGFYQVRNGKALEIEGIFFDPATISVPEEKLIRDYAVINNLTILTVAEFRSDIFLKYGYIRCGTVVGFNLPFDLSRIALSHSPARRSMREGFSFALTQYKQDPRVRVKHLSPRAAIIDFATPGDQDTPRGMRNRELKVPPFRGHFVDVKTLASALTSRRFNLRSLALYLQTPTQKLDTDEHGEITKDYLNYARADVQVTWECFDELSRRYAEHGLSKGMDRILSEASIGKSYLQEMGIRPFLSCEPSFPRERFGEIMSAYYGGRAEVRNRREIHETCYCDFKSMYPTVNTLMGLWRFVVADGLMVHDSTTTTRKLLESVTIEDLQYPSIWQKLTTLVCVKPKEDLFPVRAKYNEQTYTIGLNFLTSNAPIWFTLADCIVSKLLTGKCPEIVQATTYDPGPIQSDLNSIDILGNDQYRIDPATDDLFNRLVDLRDEAKEKGDPIEKTLKILANSTSYGIFIEVNRDNAPKSEPITIFGPTGEKHELTTKAIEEPGRYFHPLLGVLITGAARLMLGIAEKLVLDEGLDWAFCDTDSLAMIRPDGMTRKDFHQKADAVINWFEPLNPYRKSGSILKIEDVNYGIDSKNREPLYCCAISAKRYALFNLDADGNPILRKASAHGLGHLIDPYNDNEAPAIIRPPQLPLTQIGVKRWQHDFWIKIIQAALNGKPDQVIMDWHPALMNPSASRYTASSPQMASWLDIWNEGKDYKAQIRPFGFLLSFTARSGVFEPPPDLKASFIETPKRGRPKKKSNCKPIAPYTSDPAEALPSVFDRVTGEKIEPKQLKTYAEALAQYHLSCEDKFLNGQFLDRGRTERRHVVATGMDLIGKETNRVGESGQANPVHSAITTYNNLTVSSE
ncbi:MAG: hypothetical protein B6D76_03795 [gamma proteobacterium symbiont of Stewartia floridana]|nr:MAG: hypothetical protein B6D76_03795 [gamma proteobacterium symbiont of Stewartia floridana]RLW60807.1 MAG: hypothetical protein B6D75_04880 [gamma proteobacterium symbiont of Stewartia floridana]